VRRRSGPNTKGLERDGDVALPWKWAPLTMGPDHDPVLGMPEHARLGPHPPVIHMPAKYAAVPPAMHGDRRDRGHRRGRSCGTPQCDKSCPMPDGHAVLPQCRKPVPYDLGTPSRRPDAGDV
jgi:hypothetical protein